MLAKQYQRLVLKKAGLNHSPIVTFSISFSGTSIMDSIFC